MRLRRLLAAAALLVSTSFAVAQDVPEELERHPGRKLYVENCASCHGRDARGGGASSLADEIWQYGSARSQRYRNIKFGIAAAGMPEYGETLDDRQIGQLIDYLEKTRSAVGARRSPLPPRLATRDYDVGVEVWVGPDAGLSIPWGLTFIDAKTALVTERPGTLRVIRVGDDGAEVSAPVKNTPEVLHTGQGGLMDVAVDPEYAESGWLYLCYTHGLAGEGRGVPSMTRVVRGKLDGNAWTSTEVVWEAATDHYLGTRHHYGSRIAFDPDGLLYFGIGDRGRRPMAQDLGRPNGKVHRVHRDGRIPKDNPFVATEGALPSIWSYGHRNPQGLATHPATGRIWETEHGPMGGDELNLIERAANYGWPEISYGINYNGTVLTPHQRREGMRQPVLFWTPSIAVCGMDFLHDDQFPRWQNHALVTGLAHETLIRLHVEDDRVIHQETLLQGHGRVRDVAVAPDGSILVVQNGPDRILRLTNQGEAERQ